MAFASDVASQRPLWLVSCVAYQKDFRMTALQTYLAELAAIRSTGAAVPETSYYSALANLFNAVGKTLKPKVNCVINLANRGAGIPDGGLFTADQLQKGQGKPVAGAIPSRGVIEVKGTNDDSFVTARGKQVTKYWKHYGLVLVTNYRDFVLVGKDEHGEPVQLETYRLAVDESAFWRMAGHPAGDVAKIHDKSFTDFLQRVMLYSAALERPQDLAWFLASYARDALSRIEHKKLPALDSLRTALEESLGLKFEGGNAREQEKGEHFFRSTLIQTLFYGVFSAWVLWHNENPVRKDRFDWKQAAWSLHVPMIRSLFDQIATPSQLGPLGLVEPLEWAAAALNRVSRGAFFSSFDQGHAVQYFYEPFLEHFDPELRKDLGVWYTPPEVVAYMVGKVDAALREELHIAEGLADPSVYVLDPCCGTGAFLVGVLNRIAATMKAKGTWDAASASELKTAAMSRIFGFEIMPAPFVVAHLQLGLLLQTLQTPLEHATDERVAIYLTNALTGWEPPTGVKQHLIFREMEQERDRADEVKRKKPILVILGNPPYNGYAGIAIEEERGLTNAYRTSKRVAAPEGQGLNDLYIRFYRMAERQIVSIGGQGVVSFISNYSWLDGRSFTGMRESYCEVFDKITIDCLNGDKYKTGKLTPEGKPDPSIFSTPFNREGIQVGTTIATMVRRKNHRPLTAIQFRDVWGTQKHKTLVEDTGRLDQIAYREIAPVLPMGLPFTAGKVSADYCAWPELPALFPVSFPGIQSGRDDLVVDIDRDQLNGRIERFFDPAVSHEEAIALAPVGLGRTSRFDAKVARALLLKRGMLTENVVRYLYRPFDVRWLYWEPETKLLDEKRSDYVANLAIANRWFAAVQQNRKQYDPPIVTKRHAARHVIERGANLFPLMVRPDDEVSLIPQQGAIPKHETGWRYNLSPMAVDYLNAAGVSNQPDLLHSHAIAILHSPAYATDNAGALRQDWPRIPLPAEGKALEDSAELGKLVAALLDAESAVKGVTASPMREELRLIGSLQKNGGGSINPAKNDLEVTAGWGHAGKEGATMPGGGKVVRRDYDEEETAALRDGAAKLGITLQEALDLLGHQTCDVYLNGGVYWCNIPANVYGFVIGGYQVIKKWLSYREQELLGRGITMEEAREVQATARRLAAILLLHPKLDENYAAVKTMAYDWAAVRE